MIELCPEFTRHAGKMRAASEAMALTLRVQTGVSWPCGHFRSPENTQTVKGKPGCRICRRRRWQKGFRMAVLRRQAEQPFNAAAREKWNEQQVNWPGNGKLPFDVLLESVANEFRLNPYEVQGKGRRKALTHCRAVIIRILLERGLSYPTIGRLLSGRDHSTIMHSKNNFEIYERINPIVTEAYLKFRDRRP